jgi:hypothetical protein
MENEMENNYDIYIARNLKKGHPYGNDEFGKKLAKIHADVKVEMNKLKCPKCDGEVHWYHGGISNDYISRAVCKKKCEGWKVIKKINRFKGQE